MGYVKFMDLSSFLGKTGYVCSLHAGSENVAHAPNHARRADKDRW